MSYAVCPLLLKEQAYCTGLSEVVRLECIKPFCYAAKDAHVRVTGIVDSDAVIEGEEEEMAGSKNIQCLL